MLGLTCGPTGYSFARVHARACRRKHKSAKRRPWRSAHNRGER
jgi:hypothetical protein